MKICFSKLHLTYASMEKWKLIQTQWLSTKCFCFLIWYDANFFFLLYIFSAREGRLLPMIRLALYSFKRLMVSYCHLYWYLSYICIITGCTHAAHMHTHKQTLKCTHECKHKWSNKVSMFLFDLLEIAAKFPYCPSKWNGALDNAVFNTVCLAK